MARKIELIGTNDQFKKTPDKKALKENVKKRIQFLDSEHLESQNVVSIDTKTLLFLKIALQEYTRISDKMGEPLAQDLVKSFLQDKHKKIKLDIIDEIVETGNEFELIKYLANLNFDIRDYKSGSEGLAELCLDYLNNYLDSKDHTKSQLLNKKLEIFINKIK